MNTLSIDIRKAEPRDAPAIADVHHQAWRGAYAGIIPHRALTTMVNRRGSDWWANAIRRAASVLVVEIGGTIAGYATIEYQGIGLGSRLFAAARARLRDHGLKGMVVWALEDNANALDFYAGAGGRDVAEGVEVFDQKALRKVAFVWD